MKLCEWGPFLLGTAPPGATQAGMLALSPILVSAVVDPTGRRRHIFFDIFMEHRQ